MKHRLGILIIAVIMCISLTGCGGTYRSAVAKHHKHNHKKYTYSLPKTNTPKSSGNTKKSYTAGSNTKNYSTYNNSYDAGYDAVYDDDDYDENRYYSDDDYAAGVDDAMDELGEDW